MEEVSPKKNEVHLHAMEVRRMTAQQTSDMMEAENAASAEKSWQSVSTVLIRQL